MTRTITGQDFVTIASFINCQSSVPIEVIDAITRVAEAEWCVGCGLSQACDQCQMEGAAERAYHEADGETYDKVCDSVCDACGSAYDSVCDACGNMASSDDLVPFYGHEYFKYMHQGCGEALGLRRLSVQSLAK